MTKSRIAEWILSQVLPPDRAASTVGDWMEDVDKRGDIWFWSSVIRTAVSRVWSDLTENPLTMAGVGLLGFARSILVVIGIVVLEFFWLAHYNYIHNTEWLEGALDYPLIAWWYFQTGRWVARRMAGRELAGYVAIALTGWLTAPAWWTFAPREYGPMVPAWLLVAFSHDLCILAGALWFRRRQLHPVG